MSSHSSRGSRVRTKVAALLISLIALWAFAAYVTLQDGTNLLSLTTLDGKIGRPSEALVANLQKERRLSLVYLGEQSASHRDELTKQRRLTDQTRSVFETNVDDTSVTFAASAALEQRLHEVVSSLGGLAGTRESIDSGATERIRAAATYTNMIDAGFRIYGSLVTLDDDETAKLGRTLVTLSRATELLSQEDALLAGALTAGTVTSAEHVQVVELIGTQRFLYHEAVAELPEADRARYQQIVQGQSFQGFTALEERISQAQASGASLPITAGQWDSAVGPVLEQLRQLTLQATDSGLALAKPVAIWVVVRLLLAGGLGLVAVIASIVISITTARDLVRQLERLRNAARDLASYRLPRVVERLQHGEKVDVESEAPPLDFGNDEIGQVGQAFNDVQSTAVRVAVEQAELRRSVRDVFLSLARRSQALLHRQLGLLDAMERRSTDAEELGELFRIDHLATRMRRNAENLIVLSGATAGRAWRKPVPMVDVLRGALAEVEDYTRVTVLPVVPASLVGRAVGDVIHLLAELIENAVSFSPPQTVVRVGGSVVGNGFAIEIEDRGLGMSEEDRALANEQLNDPPEFKLSSTARLGLYVVGKLAERHGVRVRLTESPYGGTTAIVLLPATLMADGDHADRQDAVDAADGPDPLDGPDLSPWAALTPGRHRHDGEGEQPALPVRPTTTPAPPIATPVAESLLGPPLGESPFAASEFAPSEFAEQTPLNGHYSPPSFVSSLPTLGDTDTPNGGQNGTASMPSIGPDPTAGDTAPARPADPVVLTPAGLPFRQRDKGTPPLIPTTPAAPTSISVSTPPGTSMPDAAMAAASMDTEDGGVPQGRASRPPEQVRSIMASYRSGTLRGRIDAARLSDTNSTPEWTEAPQESRSTDEEG